MTKIKNSFARFIIAIIVLNVGCNNQSDMSLHKAEEIRVIADTLNLNLREVINSDNSNAGCRNRYLLSVSKYIDTLALNCYGRIISFPITRTNGNFDLEPIVMQGDLLGIVLGYDTYCEVSIFNIGGAKFELVYSFFCSDYFLWYNEEAKTITYFENENTVLGDSIPARTKKVFNRVDFATGDLIDSLVIVDVNSYNIGSLSSASIRQTNYIDSLFAH